MVCFSFSRGWISQILYKTLHLISADAILHNVQGNQISQGIVLLYISYSEELSYSALFSFHMTDIIQTAVSVYFLSFDVRYNDVMQRCKELDSWTQDLSLPSVVWLSGLFNPQSFLTGKIHLQHIENLY